MTYTNDTPCSGRSGSGTGIAVSGPWKMGPNGEPLVHRRDDMRLQEKGRMTIYTVFLHPRESRTSLYLSPKKPTNEFGSSTPSSFVNSLFLNPNVGQVINTVGLEQRFHFQSSNEAPTDTPPAGFQFERRGYVLFRPQCC